MRYRMYETVNEGLKIEVLYGDEHVAQSPYILKGKWLSRNPEPALCVFHMTSRMGYDDLKVLRNRVIMAYVPPEAQFNVKF